MLTNLILYFLNLSPLKGSNSSFWFDGTWDQSWIKSHEFTYALEKELRTIKPDLIIGSRFRNDEYGKRHFDSNGILLGDYEQGWERKLPEDISWLDGNDWDCVMTIPPNGWGYMKDWSGLYTKTTDDIIELMMKSVSMNGNFVLNFGPDGLGNMHPGEDVIAKELGEWMKVNGEAVHAVRHADFPKTNYGYYTQKGNTLYLTVVNRPNNGVIRIPVIKNSKEVPVKALILGSSFTDLRVKHADIGYDLDKKNYYDVIIPKEYNSDRAFVLKMQLGEPRVNSSKLMDAKM